MPCAVSYLTPEERLRQELEQQERELQERRDASFKRLEEALSQGRVQVETDPFTGQVKLAGMTDELRPEGMSDLCILAGLQRRNSLAFQLVQGSVDFNAAHEKAHALGIPHGHYHNHNH